MTSEPQRKSHNPIVYVKFTASFTQWKLSAIEGLFNYTAQKNINQSQYSQKKKRMDSLPLSKKKGKSCLVFQGSTSPVLSKMTWIDDLKIAIILNIINLFSSGMGLT